LFLLMDHMFVDDVRTCFQSLELIKDFSLG
jgi:hypothetical protein